MSLTAHFIDNDWKLNKKMLNFFRVSSCRGDANGKAILMCLRDWGIDKVFTITVDNASTNDDAISFLKNRFNLFGMGILRGKYLHLKCISDIINLIVSDVLNEFNDLVARVRGAVIYVRQSSSSLQKFKECVEIQEIQSKNFLCLDVSTKWNSTYLMLDVAQKFERAFERFEDEDPFYKDELLLGDGVPDSNDWVNVRRLVLFLQPFYELPFKVAGSFCVTSNIFLGEICEVYRLLRNWQSSSDAEFSTMAKRMKEKYDKYWGNVGKMNVLLYVAVVLDPRNKLDFVEFCFTVMYAEEEAEVMTKEVKEAVFELLYDYKRMMELSQSKQVSDRSQMSQKTQAFGDTNLLQKKKRGLSSDFKKYRESRCTEQKTDLDKYLSQELVDDEDDDDDEFNILDWWKSNSRKFPVLSHLAHDVLAIPISTATSKSAFNTGRCELDAYRGSLTSKVVQSLVCARDWLRRPSHLNPTYFEEEMEEIDKLDLEFSKIELESALD
ncbi:PREDICTED: zinc finger BED domain-containing protein RICESLEEPER 2 isoform X1 [Theobroma cacao]|uniref:Zinc finger BED domain-containing protein RICESLEEPER 2 isoform X1 n=1 Tax=Theobroma cacao TaxID=3641 RepID=A0AB32WNU3_THECC|nr:PREDICTED: zinc finger BED domain-containing protein RICESLEEPER 2 isoform X1 [Theobroma cacao]